MAQRRGSDRSVPPRSGRLFELGKSLPYKSIARQSAAEQWTLVREGVPAAFVQRMADDLGIRASALATHLGIERRSFARKLYADAALSGQDGASALGLARLVGEFQHMVSESGDPQASAELDVPAWTGQWLSNPVPALGGRCPLEFLDNAFGQGVILQLIGQIRSGAFA